MRLEVPCGGLQGCAREPVPAHALTQGRIDRFRERAVEIAACDPREQDALDQVARACERLFRIERELKRGALAVAGMASGVVQDDDQRPS